MDANPHRQEKAGLTVQACIRVYLQLFADHYWRFSTPPKRLLRVRGSAEITGRSVDVVLFEFFTQGAAVQA